MMLEGNRLKGHFIVHWLTALVVMIILIKLITLIRNQSNNTVANIPAWLLCSYIVIFVSVECHLAVNAIFYSRSEALAELQRVYIKTVLPILWGLCSFAFMWLGMKYKFKTLRIISLTLFSIILVKLFMYDIRNIPVAGKIAAFFCLGILLLIVSFMYQRLKKIIIEDEIK